MKKKFVAPPKSILRAMMEFEKLGERRRARIRFLRLWVPFIATLYVCYLFFALYIIFKLAF